MPSELHYNPYWSRISGADADKFYNMLMIKLLHYIYKKCLSLSFEYKNFPIIFNNSLNATFKEKVIITGFFKKFFCHRVMSLYFACFHCYRQFAFWRLGWVLVACVDLMRWNIIYSFMNVSELSLANNIVKLYSRPI